MFGPVSGPSAGTLYQAHSTMSPSSTGSRI
jgi:hypothetical protein